MSFAVLGLGLSSLTFANCDFGNVYEDLQCYEKQFSQAKVQLNKTYQKLYQQQNTNTQQALEQSQTAWLNYRDKQCNGLMGAIGSEAQGAGSGLIVTSCLAEMTTERSKTLAELLD
ncbi:lysozyme inhibitor LprI family protein [Acinetobacter sp. c1-l78]